MTAWLRTSRKRPTQLQISDLISPRTGVVGYRSENGQSTVEFALVLPLVLILIVGLLQVAVLARDQIVVLGAAREGVREAIVNSDRGAIVAAAQQAAPGLQLQVDVNRGTQRGDPAKVDVAAAPAKLPIMGEIVDGMTLRASATMRMERSDDAGP